MEQPEDLETAIRRIDTAMEAACKDALELRRNPHPRGNPWWNEDCMKAQADTRATRPGPARKTATKVLKQTIIDAKWKWVHEKLHQAVDT
jgi:hypothetical protein